MSCCCEEMERDTWNLSQVIDYIPWKLVRQCIHSTHFFNNFEVLGILFLYEWFFTEKESIFSDQEEQLHVLRQISIGYIYHHQSVMMVRHSFQPDM